MKLDTTSNQILNIIHSIEPYDELEKEHIDDTISWIKSGAEIFRIQKPDIPNTHLVSYFILFDEKENKILLVDHKNANLWLPAGGHVEINEHPNDTAKRECLEELGTNADFFMQDPIFLTNTFTVGKMTPHIDVSLWYVLKGDSQVAYKFDTNEFHDIRWFYLDDIPYEKSDPHMKRFIEKLKGMHKKNAEMGF